MSECQKLIREKVYGSTTHDGATLYDSFDERSFIIDPLGPTSNINTKKDDIFDNRRNS
jgi:hypothetical protein